MNKVTFDYERKGYAVEQVDKYIDVLQENYKKLQTSAEGSESKVKELEENLDEEKKSFKHQLEEKSQMNRTVNSKNAELKGLLEKLKSETAKQQEQLNEYGNRTDQLKDRLSVLESEKCTLQALLDAGKEENKSLQEENRGLQEENGNLKDENRNLEEEIESLKDENEKFNKENDKADLKETDSTISKENHTTNTKKRDDIGKYLSEIYAKAEEQAEEYIENVKREMEEERGKLKLERDSYIAEAEKEAEQIKEAARQQKLMELEAEENRLAQEYEERMSEIEYMKQEAEIEKNNAKEEAESILRQAHLKLALSEEKNKLLVEKALGKSKRIENEMETQYQQLQDCLVDSAKRMTALFEYLANINEAKDIEEIRKYAELPAKE